MLLYDFCLQILNILGSAAIFAEWDNLHVRSGCMKAVKSWRQDLVKVASVDCYKGAGNELYPQPLCRSWPDSLP